MKELYSKKILMKLGVRGLLPMAYLWAARHESLILRHGVRLSPTLTSHARRLGVAHPEKVRLLAVDLIPPTNRLLRSVGTRFGIVSLDTIGMTLRYGIFIKASQWGDRRLLLHELTHVAQYERLGGFYGFLYSYLCECISPGYPLGPLEQEAKRAERSSD